MRAHSPLSNHWTRAYRRAVKINLGVRAYPLLETAAEGGRCGPAEAERKRHRDKAVKTFVAARGERHVALEARLIDLDVARCGSEHASVVDEEGLGGVGPDGDLAGDGDHCAIEHAVSDFDSPRVFGIEALPPPQVEQPALEPPLLFRARSAARPPLA